MIFILACVFNLVFSTSLEENIFRKIPKNGQRMGESLCGKRDQWDEKFQKNIYWSSCPKGENFFFEKGTFKYGYSYFIKNKIYY